jgi:hypothetical protein
MILLFYSARVFMGHEIDDSAIDTIFAASTPVFAGSFHVGLVE